jgi:hypothetical protein
MATESTRQQPSGFRTFIWALFFFFVFALLVVLWVRSTGTTEGYEDKRAAFRTKIKEDRTRDDIEKLTTAGWVDQAKGIVRVPIVFAKKAVVSDLKGKKPTASAVKVEAPLPVPAIDPNSAEPPPSLLPSAPQGADMIAFPAPAAAPAAAIDEPAVTAIAGVDASVMRPVENLQPNRH